MTYDEFTADIAENQILRTALRRMLAVPRLSDAARAGLGHLDGRLARGDRAAPGAALPAGARTVETPATYRALRLAEMVLATRSAETGPGSYRWRRSSWTWPRCSRTSSGPR